jgi:hypothetical protein
MRGNQWEDSKEANRLFHQIHRCYAALEASLAARSRLISSAAGSPRSTIRRRAIRSKSEFASHIDDVMVKGDYRQLRGGREA